MSQCLPPQGAAMLNNSSLQLHCLAALQNPVVTWTWTVALFQVSSSHMLDLADRQDCYSCMPAFRLATMKPFAERTAKDSPCMTCTQSLHSSLRLCCAMLSCVVACCAVPRRAVLYCAAQHRHDLSNTHSCSLHTGILNVHQHHKKPRPHNLYLKTGVL